jgi:dolichyl-phosphate-mannose--protein O-mannosyl transferase
MFDDPSQRGQSTITDMGNPALWWPGLFALLFCVWRMLAGPMWLRLGVTALMVVSLILLIVTFRAAEQPLATSTGVQPGPILHVSPLLYVGFAGMVVFCIMAVIFAVVSRRFVPAFIVLGYTAGWLMWVPGNEQRVLFFYHALGMLLFLALAAAYALSAIRRITFSGRGRWWSLAPIAHAGVAVVVSGFIFFYPVWTAIPQNAADHQMRVWVDTW